MAKYRIQKIIVPGRPGMYRPSSTYMVIGRDSNGKAVIRNFLLKKSAENFIKRRSKK